MNGRIPAAAALAVMLLACAAHAQSVKRPQPPVQVCIGGNCVTTPAPAQSGRIKWNPGHYAAGNGSLLGGKKASDWYPTMDHAMGGWKEVKGFRMWISWGAIETTEGVYDFSQVDAVLNRMKTQYGTPRHLVLTLYPSGPVSNWKHDGRVVPLYIQDSPKYGPSPVAGTYGWWGVSKNGVSTGQFEPALWRPAVMSRYIALVQAIAAHYDNDPQFEALMFQEDAYGALAQGSDYSQAAMAAQIKNLLTASVAAFPHTSVIMENTWGPGGASGTQNLELWMVQNRVAPGTADTLGLSAFKRPTPFGSNGGPGPINWGIAAYMGRTYTSQSSEYGGQDLRLLARAMVDIEGDDIGGAYYAGAGGPFTPLDICNALNQEYKASHAFWVFLWGTETMRKGAKVPDSAKWSNLFPVVVANPLTNTGYPPNYPQ
jgi:hypothetical protein